MPKEFPAPYIDLENQNTFSGTEVGLNHPFAPSHVRLHDNGDVELTAGEVSMIMHAPQRTITFVADQVKFVTKDDGLRWNRLSFNKDAYQYQQPTFFQVMDNQVQGLYRGADVFLKTKDERNTIATELTNPATQASNNE